MDHQQQQQFNYFSQYPQNPGHQFAPQQPLPAMSNAPNDPSKTIEPLAVRVEEKYRVRQSFRRTTTTTTYQIGGGGRGVQQDDAAERLLSPDSPIRAARSEPLLPSPVPPHNLSEGWMKLRRSPSGERKLPSSLVASMYRKVALFDVSGEGGGGAGTEFGGIMGAVSPPRSRKAIMLILVAILLLSFLSLEFTLFAHRSSGERAKPYSPSVERGEDGSFFYHISVVTDLDHDSADKEKKDWVSHLKTGRLTLDADWKSARVQWNEASDVLLRSNLASGGRAMELSDLCVFDGKLLTIDDRTGVVYQILGSSVIPWVLLNDGPGNVTKGLKGEWMTVKDGELYIGGLGKEWTNSKGVYENDHPMWVKRVDRSGRVRHVDWSVNYRAVRRSVGISYPGYMVHEAVQWSDERGKWVFLPRRASMLTYDEETDERRGVNLVIETDDSFSNAKAHAADAKVSMELDKDRWRGFSAFQFLPHTDDRLVVALKSEERDGRPVATFITVFDLDSGNVLLPEAALTGAYKYEGIAIL